MFTKLAVLAIISAAAQAAWEEEEDSNYRSAWKSFNDDDESDDLELSSDNWELDLELGDSNGYYGGYSKPRGPRHSRYGHPHYYNNYGW